DKLDSQNTLKAFLGKSKIGRKGLVIEGMFNYAYRKGDWSLIPPYHKEREYKLYNLKKDIEQKHNLSDIYPKKLKELINEFEKLKESTGKKTKF
ncbi:MAG: arylsulfatase, partial [Bacteroides sp.]